MATIPVVNTVDKRIGFISAIVLMIITFIVLLLLTYDIPNPPPQEKQVRAVADLEEIELKELVVEGGAGGGDPSDAPIDEPKPQTLNTITSNKPSRTTTSTGGQANNTNTQNSQNASSGNASTNPFGGGGSGGGTGGGDGTGFGTDSGVGTGTGPGIGYGKGRTRLNNVDVNDITIETDADIYYKLTVDASGTVLDFSSIGSKTTTTDQTLINKIGYAIKKQVKYNKVPGSPPEYVFYTVYVKAT